jgi:hypothetical protein
MLARLSRKAEEREKYKRACDKRPAEHLELDSDIWVILPNDTWDLDDLGIVTVRVGPAFPRVDTNLRIPHDDIRPQGNGPEYLDGGNAHQAEVSATTETMGRRHPLPELSGPTIALVERINGYD